MCSVHTRTLSIIFSEFGTNVSVKLSKLLPTPSDKHFVGKQFFLKYFFIVLDFGRYIFLTDDNFIVAKLSKLFSTTSAENFDKKFLLKNTSSFFPDREHFLFWLSAKFLQRIVQTPFYVFRKPFEDADFFQFFVFGPYSDFEQIFLTFGTNFFVKLSKLLSPCLDEHFAGKFFFGKFFNLSSDFEQNIFWTWLKFSQKSIQKPILRVQKTFWGNCFSENFLIPMYTRTMSESVSEFC